MKIFVLKVVEHLRSKNASDSEVKSLMYFGMCLGERVGGIFQDGNGF